MSAGFLLTGTRDGGDSSNIKQNPSTTNVIPSKSSSPIFINVHPRIHYTSAQQRSFTYKPQSSTFHRNTEHIPLENDASINSSKTNTRQSNPCSVCQRINHRTVDCYYKKPYGCYKCGQSDHNTRDCSQVFD